GGTHLSMPSNPGRPLKSFARRQAVAGRACPGLAGMVVAALALGAVSALAQIPSAAVGGTVVDSSKAVLAGASVTLRDRDTRAGPSPRPGRDGRYRLLAVEPGDYDLEVDAPGFNGRRQPLALRVGDDPTIDFELAPGFAASVEIEGQASGLNAT